MTPTALADIFNGIRPPLAEESAKPLYAVMAIPSHSGNFVGKDKESLPCLLVSTSDQAGRPHPPIRLESLDARFELRCHLKKANEWERVVTRVLSNDGICHSWSPRTSWFLITINERIESRCTQKPDIALTPR